VALSAPPDSPLAACRGRWRASVLPCRGSRLGRPGLTVIMSRHTCSPAPVLLPYAARASNNFPRCHHRATPSTAALPAGVPALPLALTIVLAGWPRSAAGRSTARSNSCRTAPVPVSSGDPRTAFVALVSEAPSPSDDDQTLISCVVAVPHQLLFLDVRPGVAAMLEQSIVQDSTPLDIATAAGREGRLVIRSVPCSCDGDAIVFAAGDIILHASGHWAAVGDRNGRILSADTCAGYLACSPRMSWWYVAAGRPADVKHILGHAER